MKEHCEIKNCDGRASYYVKFGPPKIEFYNLCEEHADAMIQADLSIEHWAEPEVLEQRKSVGP